MTIVSVNVGIPREVQSGGATVLTSIFKSPVSGRVAVRGHNLEGDRQSDLKVHGGVSKAVYAYPSEHYPFWREQLGVADLPWASFGENLSTEGLTEKAVHVGDRFRIGSVELVVTQPRMPCFKLGIRFGRADMVKRFLRSRRSGFYLAIEKEGELGAGDTIERLATDPRRVSIRELLAMYLGEIDDPSRVRAAIEVPSLPDGWRQGLAERLAPSS